jgi:hypothetical protein
MESGRVKVTATSVAGFAPPKIARFSAERLAEAQKKDVPAGVAVPRTP